METIFRISASQLDSFLRCPRSWAWKYIARKQQEPQQATELGSRVHAVIEAHYLEKKQPDLNELWRFQDDPANRAFYPGVIALSMIQSVPRPAYPFRVEVPFETTVGTVVYIGRVDLMYVAGHVLFIIDHKTSSDPHKWGKNPSALSSDMQALVYSGLGVEIAEKAGLDVSRVTQVQFCLNYGSTDGNPRKKLVINAPREEAPVCNRLRLLNEVQPIAEYMVKLRRAETNPLQLAASTDACEMFGGCPFKSDCNLTVGERLKGIIMKNSLISGLLEKAKARPLDPIPSDNPVATVAINPPEEVYQQLADDIAQGLSQAEPEPAPVPEEKAPEPKKKAAKLTKVVTVDADPEKELERLKKFDLAPKDAVAVLDAALTKPVSIPEPDPKQNSGALKSNVRAAASAGRLAGMAHGNPAVSFDEIDALLEIILEAIER